jgi:hypothetical protein
MARAGSFRHVPDLEALTPFPVPWSYPSKNEEIKEPKYDKYPAFSYPVYPRYKPLNFPPFPHQKDPDMPKVKAKDIFTLGKTLTQKLSEGRMKLIIKDGRQFVARVLLKPGQKITANTRVYIAKVKGAKETGTGYPVYILRVVPNEPKAPGKNASSAEIDRYNEKVLAYRYKFDRASYWEAVKFLKQQRMEQREANRDAWEAGRQKYLRQKAAARKEWAEGKAEYERKVSMHKLKWKRALAEYQISKIGSYYGNKYTSLYGSYYS